jgi:hypothetical protein
MPYYVYTRTRGSERLHLVRAAEAPEARVVRRYARKADTFIGPPKDIGPLPRRGVEC